MRLLSPPACWVAQVRSHWWAQPGLAFWLQRLWAGVDFFGFSVSRFSHLLKENNKSACFTG